MDRQHKWLVFVLGICFSVVFAGTLNSWAQDGVRVIRYDGKLLQAGQPHNGYVDLLFAFGTVDDSGFVERWRESHDDVPVYSGVFEVAIGSNTPLDDWVVEGVDVIDDEFIVTNTGVHLLVSVRHHESDSDEDYVRLVQDAQTPSRRIHPVPFAYQHSTSSDLHIDADAELTEIDAEMMAAQIVSADTITANTFHGTVRTLGEPYLTLGDIQVSAQDSAAVVDASSTAGIRFDIDGTTKLQLANGATIVDDANLVIKNGGNLNIVGAFHPPGKENSGNLIQKEDETSLSASNFVTQTADLGSANRRFCALTRLIFAQRANPRQFENCEISIVNGNYRLLSSSSGPNSSTCAARCITW